jgi:hypothetical protein
MEQAKKFVDKLHIALEAGILRSNEQEKWLENVVEPINYAMQAAGILAGLREKLPSEGWAHVVRYLEPTMSQKCKK